MKTRTASLDYAAVTLSSLCLIHCLLLPALAVTLPLAGVLSELEWLHRSFVLLAVPLSIFAFVSSAALPHRRLLLSLALMGCLLLLAGAFVEVLHDHEVLLTVFGALLLGGAHVGRIIRRRHAHP